MRSYTQPPSSLACIGGASAGSVSRRAPTLFSKATSRGKKASQEKKKDPVAAGSQMEEQETLYAKREEVGRLRA